jgi:hypothetical protein
VVDCVVNVDGGFPLAENPNLRQILEIFLWKFWGWRFSKSNDSGKAKTKYGIL